MIVQKIFNCTAVRSVEERILDLYHETERNHWHNAAKNKKAIKRLLVNDAPEKLLKDQAVDMVLTEEQLDFLASLKVRARKEGLEEGRAEGKAEGKIEGRDDERVATALDMLADNEPVEKVVKYSHLPEEKVLELRDSRALAAAK